MGYNDSLMGQNERIEYQTRQHWIHLVPTVVIDVILISVIGILSGLASIPTAGLGGFLGVLALLPLGHFAKVFLDWYNEVYIVTNRRVIQIEGVINKHVIDSSLEKVNDVVLTQSFWGRMLNYGDVEILTGSEIGVNLLHRINGPVRFKTAMLDAKEKLGELGAFETRARQVSSEAPTAGDVPELIAELDELRQKGIISQEEFDAKKKKLLEQI
jgi:uncharacterized membrane protein YdbT with pleckstrin-like domain